MSRKKLSQIEFEELAYFSKLFEDAVRDEVRKIENEINIRGIKEKTMPKEIKLEPMSKCESSIDGKHEMRREFMYHKEIRAGFPAPDEGKLIRRIPVWAERCLKCRKWGRVYE